MAKFPGKVRIGGWKIILNHTEQEQNQPAEYLPAEHDLDWPTWRIICKNWI